MSKERALLKEALYVIGEYTEDAQERTEILIAEIEKLLAQPEQSNEPEAWMLIDKETGARIPKAYKPEHGVNKDRWELYPLFASPPTREPLSDGEIRDGLDGKNGFENWYDDRFVDGIQFAEKHHGIGGGE
jgi:hypothetical protein